MSEPTSTTTTVQLYKGDSKGKTVKTSFGTITFDKRGCATIEADEATAAKLHALGWLGDPPAPTEAEKLRDGKPRENVMLYSDRNKNKEVKTSMGDIQFDAKGYASFDATPDEMVKFSALGWLGQPQPTMENMERARSGEPTRGPTIEEFVAAGYLPEEYVKFVENRQFELIEDKTYKTYVATGKGPWDERLVQDKRDMLAKRDAETRDREEAQAKAEAAKAALSVAATPAPKPVAADAVPAKHGKKH